MPMIPEDEIERIKRGTDLAAVVRTRGIELKAQGGDLVGLCPFHDDHAPSLRVTPGKGLWRCMSCGATGNVIQFVQRFDGVSFRHAFEVLKGGAVPLCGSALKCAPVKKTTVPKLSAPVAADADDQAALKQVLDYYHERLAQNLPALDYLKKRGINEAAMAAFGLGFVDRTLGLRLPQKNRKEGAELRERLTRLGVLRDTGHEHLRGRIVFPVVAADGTIGTVYGRAIDEHGRHDRHLFLPGPQRGVFNPAALRSPVPSGATTDALASSIILTEGIIDALTFWCAGFQNVTCAYSAKTLPEELLDALIAAKTQRVLIAFDRDEAGDKGSTEVSAQLTAHGIECHRVMFPHGQDANRYALSVTPANRSLGVLLRSAVAIGDERTTAARQNGPGTLPGKGAALATPARVLDPRPVNASTLRVPAGSSLAAKAAKGKVSSMPVNAINVLKDEPEEVILAVGDREYRVRGLAKNTGFESLKVSLRIACEERWHLDTLDLCVARQRESFITSAAVETLLKPELIKRDLGKVLGKLEELQEARLKAGAEKKGSGSGGKTPALSAQDRSNALALLRDPKLFDRIVADFAACGVVGEETNKLIGYLAAVSRKLDAPLAVIVQSTSAAGKSALMEAVLAFVPPEERMQYSALTGQALYYLGDADLKHKILAIAEEEGAERASYALKLLQSEGELTIASTGKDPHTGRMTTQEYRVEGPVMIFLTTTAVDIDEELLNRCLVLTVDEGREQTAAIHRLQRERETLAGLLRQETRSQILATHRAAQRLLRPLRVVNPFAEQLTFLDDRTRTRRDHMKYLTLIRTIALLHQYQREVKTTNHGSQRIDYIEVSLDDIAVANRLAHDVLGRCLDEMPPQTRRLLLLLEKMVGGLCAKRKVECTDIAFTRRQVREYTGWGNSQLHLHLSRLVDLEYVLTHRADHGLVYELVYDGAGKDGKRFLSGLLDTQQLRRAYDYDEKHPGPNADHPAPVRPRSGPHPGPIRPAQNDVNALTENGLPTRPALNAENAHLDAAPLAAAS